MRTRNALLILSVSLLVLVTTTAFSPQSAWADGTHRVLISLEDGSGQPTTARVSVLDDFINPCWPMTAGARRARDSNERPQHIQAQMPEATSPAQVRS